MAYIKNTWLDQQVERPRTYQFNPNPDGSTTLIDDFGKVTELGTPVNADNMNHIEDGIANSATVDLDNLSEKGKLKVLDGKITNCILEAPNGVFDVQGVTVTLSKDLKCLVCAGKNPNKTYKNVEVTIKNPKPVEISGMGAKEPYSIFLDEKGHILYGRRLNDCEKFSQLPTNMPDEFTWFIYCNETNIFYFTKGNTTPNWREAHLAEIGRASVASQEYNKFEKVEKHEPISLLTRSEKNNISSWGMPSNKNINLSLGSNGSIYTAPANGYYYLRKFSNASNQYINIINLDASQYGENTQAHISGMAIWTKVFCNKGNKIKINYTATGKTELFKFIYAKGEV